MKSLKRWLKVWFRSELPEDERRALEKWVRLRFRMSDSDPLAAIGGAVTRLTTAGMRRKQATELVLRILREEHREAS
ncbi:MAG: hypothetical protein ACREM3_12030 [Candidatus Rokuibacteriota bacterium]